MKQTKRILWHLPYGIVGGVETLYATIIKHMTATHLTHFVTCHTMIRQWVVEKYNGVNISSFTGPGDLADAIRLINPDLIVGTHGHTLYAALGLLGTQYPVVEVVHGSHIWGEHNIRVPKNYTHHIVCVSKNAEQTLQMNSNFGIPTSVILNGVDTELFKPTKELAKVPIVFGYIGRFLEGDKHLTKMIQAFKSITAPKARLHLVGGSREEIISLKHFAKRLGCMDSVRFFERTTTPEDYYKDIDIVTVRSEAEGYCNTVAEALACGIPCVCFNFGGILRHLDPGTVLIGNTQTEYANQLGVAYRNYELRQSMSRKGLDFIAHRGNAVVTANAYTNLFNQLLKKFPSRTPEIRQNETMDIPYVGKVLTKSTGNIVGVVNPHWHGIYTATRMCTDSQVFWDANPRIMVKNILDKNPRAVLFSGLCPGFELAALEVSKKVPTYSYYHGGMSHFSFAGGTYGSAERDALSKILELNKRGVFRRIAVSSPGFAATLCSGGYDVQFCGNIFNRSTLEAKTAPLRGFHIGNWNRHLDHKHTSIGLGALMQIPDATMHMLECPHRIPGIDYRRVKIYSEMAQDRLYTLYKQMTVNLQLSFIETFNISVLEMWSLGVPVIVGPGNYVLIEGSELLREHAHVIDCTNPTQVAETIKTVANLREDIIREQYKTLEILNAVSESNWRRFFE